MSDTAEQMVDAVRKNPGDVTAQCALADLMHENGIDHKLAREVAAHLATGPGSWGEAVAAVNRKRDERTRKAKVAARLKHATPAVRWFYNNGAKAVGPRYPWQLREEAALTRAFALAHAEEWLKAGVRNGTAAVTWEPDPDFHPNQLRYPSEVVFAWTCGVSKVPGGFTAALSGITFDGDGNPSDNFYDNYFDNYFGPRLKPYARYVQAELAQELIDHEDEEDE
jgi:hypothetical protein